MAKTKPIVLETAFRSYTLGSVIGEGGAGRVHEATDDLGNNYAVKILHSDRATRERRKRFQNAVAFCVRNRHENILTILDHGIHPTAVGNAPFYVMPIYDGSLRPLLRSSLTPERALRYFSQVLDGIEAAHLLGVVHRDIKPENILYDKTKDQLKVADFGIAHFREEEIYTSVDTNPAAKLANLQYAAPEQRTRGATVGIPADIYAIGLILNEMLTGHVPAGAEYPLIGTSHAALAYLDEVVGRMLLWDPIRRLPTVDAVKVELISGKKEFVERQQLLALQNRVVPAVVVVDPLVDDPPRIIDFDWGNGTLTLVLSRQVTQEWIDAFRNIGSRHSAYGADVTDFVLRNNNAHVAAEHSRVQEIINHFKEWLPRATEVYGKRLNQKREREQQQERERLQRERDEQERRLALRRSIQL